MTALKWRLKAGQDNNLVAAPANAAHLVNINPGTQSTVTACRFIFICIQSSTQLLHLTHRQFSPEQTRGGAAAGA
jgi:hypothetical protein